MHTAERTKKMKLFIVLCVFFYITSFNSVFMDENDQSEGNSPLHEAVLDDNFVNVKNLINKGADKNAKNYFGIRPVHLAAKRGLENIIRLLVSKQADINVTDNYGKLPIHFAAQNGHFEIFKFLIQEHDSRSIPYIDVTDTMGMSVLHYVAMNRKAKNTEMLDILLQKNISVNSVASDNTTPLDFACATGNLDMVKLLLEKGAGKNVNFPDWAGDTPIIYAAYGTGKDRQKVFQKLIENKAEVNVVNKVGETILFFVTRFGGDDAELAEFLIRRGARINVSNNKGETPLHVAAQKGHKKLGECFIKNKANKDARTNENQTPLHYAVKYGQFEFAELLINHGANVNVADENNMFPIHIAVEEALGHVKILELLIKDNDINNISKDGKSTLHLSIEKGGDMETFKWLVEKGANINATDRDGRSLLHTAAQHGRIHVMEWLIKNHPISEIINIPDNSGNIPLHLAAEGGYYDLTKILLSNGSDANAINYDFEFPIHYAALGGHENIIKLLIKYDAMVDVRNRNDWTPLFHSVLNGNEKAVKLLVNHKDEDLSLNDVDALGKTVFHICAERGFVSVGKILSSHGANVSATDKHGQTPLHRAVIFRNVEFIKWLLNLLSDANNGENDHHAVNVIDNDKRSPLHLAAEIGYDPVIRTLLEKNADINLKDKSNDTALSLAILNGHQNTAKILLRHSKNPNIKYAGKRDLILLAAEKGFDEIVEMLINRDGQATVEDKNKWTLLHYAAKNGHSNIVKMLLSHEAIIKAKTIDAKTENNETAVMLAVKNGNSDAVKELLKNGADLTIPDDSEKTLIDFAQQHKQNEIVDLLTKDESDRQSQARLFHIFILVIFMLLFPLMCFIALFFHKLFEKEATDSDTGLKLTDLLEKYIFPQNQVKLSTQIGKSVFGMVYKGYAHKILPHETVTMVAIKVVKGSNSDAASLIESQKMLLSLGSELKVMMYCRGHLNLVNLFGIVSENIASHELMVIVEYCRYGNLKDVLEKHHKNVKNQIIDSNTVQMSKSRTAGFASPRSVTQNDLASWSHQVAHGMQFIAAQNIVHGNLCARSIFLTDGNIVKISDFGLARSMNKVDAYISEKEGKLDYKWLSIESMQNRILTTKSDVWSFGILLWELYSFGETPYQDIDIYQLKREIQNGYTMEKPHYANDNVYEIMHHCWRINPESRPTFDSLEKWLHQLL